MSWLDDLKMKNANNASLLQDSWHEWTNPIHSFLNISLSHSLFGSVTLPLPATLSSPVSHLFFSHTAGRERRGGPTETGYADCQPAADVPGRALLSAEVLNKESLGPGAGGQAVSLSALRVTPRPLLMVLASALSHYLTPSLIHPLLAGDA